jgi:hypothetical protein
MGRDSAQNGVTVLIWDIIILKQFFNLAIKSQTGFKNSCY